MLCESPVSLQIEEYRVTGEPQRRSGKLGEYDQGQDASRASHNFPGCGFPGRSIQKKSGAIKSAAPVSQAWFQAVLLHDLGPDLVDQRLRFRRAGWREYYIQI